MIKDKKLEKHLKSVQLHVKEKFFFTLTILFNFQAIRINIFSSFLKKNNNHIFREKKY